MNTIVTNVTAIENVNNLTLLHCESHTTAIVMMSLKLNPDIRQGSQVALAVKPTNIILAKEHPQQTSCENILHATVKTVEAGELLCSVTVSFEETILEAIITREAHNRLLLKQGDAVSLLIGANDIYIQEILDV
ncbi:TOBE domain-containing protein [Sulfurimonas paralvinellae]|uniref:Mop domain-containing protein n=1 Tax=Sulfurimonas paralvinellae TaxID=317658 RepID=A0A7M1B9T7_9BACT|nr:TOBE domain-containing protein [Sulfurimonas paralvinellae]QOP46489.1 hypothetical protein FM071_09355 [Sulfurimonas paralvinellae]